MANYRLQPIDHQQYTEAAQTAALLGNPVWAAGLERFFPGSITYLGFWKGEELLAVLFLQQRRRLGVRLCHTPFLTPYTVIHWLQERREHDQRRRHQRLTAELAGWLQRRFHQAVLKFAPVDQDVRSFQWSGWTTRWRYTYLVEPPREPTAQLAKHLRRQPGLAVATEVPTAELRELITAALAANNFTHLDPGLIYAWICELVDTGVASCLVARLEGEALALQVELAQADWRGSWLQLTLPAAKSASPGSHLLAAQLRETGVSLDLLGADDPGIDEYKSASGGRLVAYPEVLWFSNTLLGRLYRRRHGW